MRGADDSIAGMNSLNRYYLQLELLSMRLPVGHEHVKVFFTWFDAFAHKEASQYSLRYEKASVIFNIVGALSRHAAHESRQKAGYENAYYSFQASAGMFMYIQKNFARSPSDDLNPETLRTLSSIMLAQAQEIFLIKQIADGEEPNRLAKLASQASYQYFQVVGDV